MSTTPRAITTRAAPRRCAAGPAIASGLGLRPARRKPGLAGNSPVIRQAHPARHAMLHAAVLLASRRSSVQLAATASTALAALASQCRVVDSLVARSRKIMWRRVGGRRNRTSDSSGATGQDRPDTPEAPLRIQSARPRSPTPSLSPGCLRSGHLGELTQYLPFELVDDVLAQTRAV
jgi:hypothetical protein